MQAPDIGAELEILDTHHQILKWVKGNVDRDESDWSRKFNYLPPSSDSSGSDEDPPPETAYREGYTAEIQLHLVTLSDHLELVRRFIFAQRICTMDNYHVPDCLKNEPPLRVPVESLLYLSPQSVAMKYLLGQPILEVRDPDDLIAISHLKSCGYGGMILLPNEKALQLLKAQNIEVGNYQILNEELELLDIHHRILKKVKLNVNSDELDWSQKFNYFPPSSDPDSSSDSSGSDEDPPPETAYREGYTAEIQLHLVTLSDHLELVRRFIFAQRICTMNNYHVPDCLKNEPPLRVPVESLLYLSPQSVAMKYLLGQPILEVRDPDDLIAISHLKSCGYGGMILLPNEKALQLLKAQNIEVGNYQILNEGEDEQKQEK